MTAFSADIEPTLNPALIEAGLVFVTIWQEGPVAATRLGALGPMEAGIADDLVRHLRATDTRDILRAFALATVDPSISAEEGDRIRRAFGRALDRQEETCQS